MSVSVLVTKMLSKYYSFEQMLDEDAYYRKTYVDRHQRLDLGFNVHIFF